MELEKSGTSKRERDEDDDITKEPKKHKGDGSFNGATKCQEEEQSCFSLYSRLVQIPELLAIVMKQLTRQDAHRFLRLLNTSQRTLLIGMLPYSFGETKLRLKLQNESKFNSNSQTEWVWLAPSENQHLKWWGNNWKLVIEGAEAPLQYWQNALNISERMDIWYATSSNIRSALRRVLKLDTAMNTIQLLLRRNNPTSFESFIAEIREDLKILEFLDEHLTLCRNFRALEKTLWPVLDGAKRCLFLVGKYPSLASTTFTDKIKEEIARVPDQQSDASSRSVQFVLWHNWDLQTRKQFLELNFFRDLVNIQHFLIKLPAQVLEHALRCNYPLKFEMKPAVWPHLTPRQKLSLVGAEDASLEQFLLNTFQGREHLLEATETLLDTRHVLWRYMNAEQRLQCLKAEYPSMVKDLDKFFSTHQLVELLSRVQSPSTSLVGSTIWSTLTGSQRRDWWLLEHKLLERSGTKRARLHKRLLLQLNEEQLAALCRVNSPDWHAAGAVLWQSLSALQRHMYVVSTFCRDDLVRMLWSKVETHSELFANTDEYDPSVVQQLLWNVCSDQEKRLWLGNHRCEAIRDLFGGLNAAVMEKALRVSVPTNQVIVRSIWSSLDLVQRLMWFACTCSGWDICDLDEIKDFVEKMSGRYRYNLQQVFGVEDFDNVSLQQLWECLPPPARRDMLVTLPAVDDRIESVLAGMSDMSVDALKDVKKVCTDKAQTLATLEVLWSNMNTEQRLNCVLAFSEVGPCIFYQNLWKSNRNMLTQRLQSAAGITDCYQLIWNALDVNGRANYLSEEYRNVYPAWSSILQDLNADQLHALESCESAGDCVNALWSLLSAEQRVVAFLSKEKDTQLLEKLFGSHPEVLHHFDTYDRTAILDKLSLTLSEEEKELFKHYNTNSDYSTPKAE